MSTKLEEMPRPDTVKGPWSRLAEWLIGGALAVAIILVGLVSVFYMMTGAWPPRTLFIGAAIGVSLGTALSGTLWRTLRQIRRRFRQSEG